ncbi:CusA/CzcA family heavy metal efflux RND transporter [Candidatus Methylacidiphilum fumarolicum]|uniref:Copper efflux pump n=2 Tax=Candidatus Methylacidiphilum fumarolicum TaxID=591154 RepID=I0JVC0_METFB|nr:CusA/CzcA family heavy metal efflux RND transporter [Candidatus Methylacidiphilum fumarolicum]MBW6414904.1 CusA/CzcA family heavy metal efflux RND transporter [Candidatus Methylacidiphilum fumarolicum]TFE68344.1 cation transporter [Candidatus Methylacidiphilum fumarolicum]TFE73567.1 CusA/CzcA family heavy metal efflux RND transporter [Candidatus Methylacidiphilum fumarolicum]TFE74972.1 CusA/CzcA family heavy metal efflux RND transporter [Candidatus Methylacidiphilum fumarolicum]TFE76513.1 c
MISRIIHWSGENPFVVLLFVFFSLCLGLYSVAHVPLDAIPDLSDVQVIVYTEWPGRSPTLVEDQITYPISTRFISAPKVKFVRGESMFGKSFVYVIFEDGTDLYWARSRVLEYLNSVRSSLPANVNPTLGPDATGVGWVYEYVLLDTSGKHTLSELRSFQDWTLRYALSSVHGVSEIASFGGYVRQYQVNIDPNKLLAYGIRFDEVVQAIQKSNQDVGGKSLEVSTVEFYIRGKGYFRNLEDISQVVVKRDRQGFPVVVNQLGDLTIGGDIRFGVTDYNGIGEAVGGIVIMRYGENALQVINGIKKKIKSLEPSFPQGVKLVPVYDRSELIYKSIETLKKKLFEECLIVSAVCVVFLWHLRSSLIPIFMLPAAVILSFIPFSSFHLTANIMSLGGIAIAIGAMIDAAIIMVENAHRSLEEYRILTGNDPKGNIRKELLLKASQNVGRPLFFSLLVITVSFLPIFALEAQEGRLFKPLAFTKTFSMFFASLLSITLVPALMNYFIRGKIIPEQKNPINRFLFFLYKPVLEQALKHRVIVLVLALLILLSTYYPLSRLGAEFMPPLNEGTILYMPTAVPGISISEAERFLNLQDRYLMTFPEVESVFGKSGQADTATDPAPLSMTETIINLKPKDQWRKGMNWDKLIAEMNQKLHFPGVANVFWMPIQTRIQMLTTGFRSVLGIKIFGKDLEELNRLGEKIEKVLLEMPETRSAYAERIEGGNYIDIIVRRDKLARYGLTVEDVNQTIEGAIGGNTVTTTIEGRERYPVNVRYHRDFRKDVASLSRILVPLPPQASLQKQMSGNPTMAIASSQIPLSEVTDIRYRQGPPLVRSENAQLVNFVFVDTPAKDLVGYIKKAGQKIGTTISFPPGYYIEWAGSYEYFLRAKAKFSLLIPLTLFIIFVLIYFNTHSLKKTLIVLLAFPFSLVGAFWFLYILNYNLSVAVAVGLIALAGIDAETGVIMLLYLDHAFMEAKKTGKMGSMADLLDAVKEGAAGRIRPKIMTVCAILFGLLPILWSQETGADVMKRIAAPMVGGVITSALLELIIYPVIFIYLEKHSISQSQTVAEKARI